MRYMDKKYKLGKTKNICGKTKKNVSNKSQKREKTKNNFFIVKIILKNHLMFILIKIQTIYTNKIYNN